MLKTETCHWTDGKTEKLAGFIREFRKTGPLTTVNPGEQSPAGPLRLLVVGCGSGLEALILAQTLPAAVTGIDARLSLRQPADDKEIAFLAALQEHGVRLQEGDATALEFADESFDLIYSYHVLEHIPHYRQALREMKRVLRPDGAFFIGTPNRSRLLGYLGSKDNCSWAKKLGMNWKDWQYRLKGNFRNEYGAHAGFTAQELKKELSAVFFRVQEITQEYYQLIYPRLAGCIRFFGLSGLARFVLPAVYFRGYKTPAKD